MQLASIFQNHGVLQRDLPLPIWGRGAPGERVTVRLAGQEAATTVDPAGCWHLRLCPLPSGGPHELVVEASSGHAVVEDLLVGDVWICSGQSNAEWKLTQCGPEWMTDSPELERVRLLTVTNPASLGRTDSVDGTWKLCTPESLAEFSAVGGHFAREIHREIGVPVGLICNAWGGSRLQAWLSREALMLDPSGREEVRFYESHVWQAERKFARKTFAEWERTDAPQDPGNLGIERGWASGDFDDSGWPMLPVPGNWRSQGHPHSGIFWFRRTVLLPESWQGRDLELSLGAIDKHDDTWVNGDLVGSTGWDVPDAWCRPRVYSVPARTVGPDRRVVIAVRARSHVYDGGMSGPASRMRLHPVGEERDALGLAGGWRSQIEHNWGEVIPPVPDWGPGNHNSPHILFDSRLAPLFPYGLRGVIWYQGESNVGQAEVYGRLLKVMIRDWRRAWGQGDFPFLQVQLANFGTPELAPQNSAWAELREAQLAVLSEPATGMAVAIDIGEAYNIHPPNKAEVARRLSRWAMAESYGGGNTPSGPLFSEMQIESGGHVRCFFRHVGSGLTATGGSLRHFSLAGKDRIFHPAEARIEGKSVVVGCREVPEPAAVRYAWAENPEGCNLCNGECLPASPFRSDSWPV